MTQEMLPGMPPIAALPDYDARVVRDRPEWAGRLMADGLSTMCEQWFWTDCIGIPVAFQHYWRETYGREVAA